MELLIKNGTIVTSKERLKADIVIDNGKIASIVDNKFNRYKENEFMEVVDAENLMILPGCMDPHVHFRDPGHTYKEDFFTGSLAAAAGGFTTVFDMPNNIPRTGSKEDFDVKFNNIKDKANIDYALYGIVRPENVNKLKELVECGVRGFKCYMGISSMNTPTADDSILWQALKELKDTGCVISVHAEDTNICSVAKQKLIEQGIKDNKAHLLSRPIIAETIAIQRAIMLAEDTGGRIHIAHISSKKSVDIIRQAKLRGVNITCETGPHNLIFSEKDYNRLGPSMYMNPPIRSLKDQQALIEGIADGTVDMIATDHAPHSEEEKFGSKNVFKSVSGCCGLEASISVMLTLVNQEKITLEKYVEISSENVAKLFNLYPQKGSIQIGSDADFTLVDLDKKGVIKKENLHSKTKVTAYDNFEVNGMPVYTILRGKILVEDGIVYKEKKGKFLKNSKLMR